MNDSNKRPRGTRWCGVGSTLTGIGVLLVGVGLLSARLGMLTPLNAFYTFGLGMFFTMLSVLALLIGLAISFGTAGAVAAARAWASLVTGIALIAIGAVNFPTRERAVIHDVTTNIDNPPEFVALVQIRADDEARNPPEYAGEETALIQQEVYPDLVTLEFQATPDAVFGAVSEVVRELGWEVAAEVQATGRIEATDVTTWFRFRDDVVIRIEPANGGSRVDIRSKSRVGRGDMGTNALRIREFRSLLQAKVS